jgi:hypothetical protein
MTMVTVIYFMRTVALHTAIRAVNRRLVKWQRGYSHEKKKVLSVEENFKVTRQIHNGKKKADVFPEFCLVNSTIQTI